MNDLMYAMSVAAQAQQAKSRDEFVRYESRAILREVNTDAVIADGAINRMRSAIERLEREVEALERYERTVYGRAPQ